MGTPSETGLASYGTYGNQPVGSSIDSLLALIPDPDAAHGTGAVAGGSGYLDEMSPGAAAQIRVELKAFKAAEGTTAHGQHVVTAGEAAANQTDIVTGLADLTITNCAVTIRRAGANVTVDAVLSKPVAGTIRVANGGTTYHNTAGDIIVWFAAA